MVNSQQQSKVPRDAEISGYAIKKSLMTKEHTLVNAAKLHLQRQARQQKTAKGQGHNATNPDTTNTENALHIANAWEESRCKSIQLKSEN